MNNTKINAIYQQFITKGYSISSEGCSGGYPDKDDCSWYHGNWMLLRYLGVVSNPYWHETFYKGALHNICANDKEYVLIAGTADFSMPLLCSETNIPKVFICDKCSTPVKICNLVSQFLGCDWKTFVQDVCSEFPFKCDIIINDAFLSRFVDKDKPLMGIYNGLKKGGYYITTLKKGRQNKGGEVTDSVRAHFMQKVRERYIQNKDVLPDLDIDAISATYVEKMASFPVENENEIHMLFKKVGLNILEIERGIVEGEFEVSEYFRVVSQKN